MGACFPRNASYPGRLASRGATRSYDDDKVVHDGNRQWAVEFVKSRGQSIRSSIPSPARATMFPGV